MMSTSNKQEIQKTSFLHVKLPLCSKMLLHDTWQNLCFDLVSLSTNIVQPQSYKSLDTFTLSG